MPTVLIVYQSQTGFTQKYAELLSARLNCPALRLKDASAKPLPPCDILVFGSRIHAGRIDKLQKARELFTRSGAKQLILFATGGTPAGAQDVIEQMWRGNLSPEELAATPHFYMPGGLCYERMSFVDRLIMKMAAKMMEKQKNPDSTAAGFTEALSGSYDISSEEYILPLTEYISAQA